MGRAVEPVPVLRVGLLNALGSVGPAEIPPKRVYVFEHTFRIAHAFGVPLVPPPAHPFNPLLAPRVTAEVEVLEARGRVGETGRGETSEAVASAVLSVGLDAPAPLAAAQAPKLNRLPSLKRAHGAAAFR